MWHDRRKRTRKCSDGSRNWRSCAWIQMKQPPVQRPYVRRRRSLVDALLPPPSESQNDSKSFKGDGKP